MLSKLIKYSCIDFYVFSSTIGLIYRWLNLHSQYHDTLVLTFLEINLKKS